ncbi:MAG: DNA polymerase III subunit gamma/tau [Oscillospiraceae bacterium]
MYQALYRKYRPKTFSEVVGQSHITDTLQRQVAEGRVGHAYLFTGTRGTGKTTCARILAKAVNCQHPVDGAPCCQCDSCRGIDAGTLLDVTELDAASNGSVNDARTLREEAVYPPSVLKKRVYIIDEVHMLSRDAFNALLKIMEEPPEHLLFILATTELHKVPATILSRCQRFSFKRILPRDAEQQLLKIAAAEDIALTSDGAEILARMANGALRDALSLLDQCRAADGDIDSRTVLDTLGLAGSTQTLQLMRCLLARNAADALALFDQLYRSGKDVAALLGELSDLSRDMTVLKAAPEGGAALLSGVYDRKTLTELGRDLPMSRFLYMADTLQSCCAALADSIRPRTAAELCLLRLCDESLSGDLTAFDRRLACLEQAVQQGAIAPSAPPRGRKHRYVRLLRRVRPVSRR